MPRIDGAPILPVVCAQVGAGVDERSPAGLGWLVGWRAGMVRVAPRMMKVNC